MKRALVAPLLLLVLAGCTGYRVTRTEGYRDISTVAFTPRTQVQYVTYTDYMTQMITRPGSAESALYIPGYAYYQGLIYTEKGFAAIGQVRLIGGVVSRQDSSLGSGAMITTNPEAMMRRVQPAHYHYQIKNWREIH